MSSRIELNWYDPAFMLELPQLELDHPASAPEPNVAVYLPTVAVPVTPKEF